MNISIIIAFIIFLAGATTILLKKIYIFQYFNLKKNGSKGTFLKALFDNSFKRQGVFDTLSEQNKFSLLKQINIDNDSLELKKITSNIKTINYIIYVLITLTFFLALMH